MRELKFRAWDHIEMNVPSLGEFNDMNDEIDNLIFDGVLLMQYTGLKDKNGVEIYEGDIASVFGSPFEIVFYEGCFGYWIWENEAYRNFITSAISNNKDDVEVIGNIYENKDLVKHI